MAGWSLRIARLAPNSRPAPDHRSVCCTLDVYNATRRGGAKAFRRILRYGHADLFPLHHRGAHLAVHRAVFGLAESDLGVYRGEREREPVVIRRTLGQLKEAGIVLVEAGVGGATLARPEERITLLDVYRAVDCVQGDLFSFHANPNPECPVGRNVHAVLDGEVAAAQHALEQRLSETTIADLDAEVELQLAKEGSRA